MITSTVTGWVVALLLGMRHASEPDHLAAISTLLAERSHSQRGTPLGVWWGIGHASALLGVGGILLLLRAQMPTRTADLCELAVAATLLVLGARSIRGAVRPGRQADLHCARCSQPATTRRAPLLVGLLHGLAGSGALTALALASMPSLGAGLVYMLVFGAGSVVGMALLTGLAEWPLRRIAQNSVLEAMLRTAAGVSSLLLGMLCGWPLVMRILQT